MDRAGNTHGANHLITDADRSGYGRHARLGLFNRRAPSSLQCLVQSGGKSLLCRDDAGAADIGSTQTAGDGTS